MQLSKFLKLSWGRDVSLVFFESLEHSAEALNERPDGGEDCEEGYMQPKDRKEVQPQAGEARC